MTRAGSTRLIVLLLQIATVLCGAGVFFLLSLISTFVPSPVAVLRAGAAQLGDADIYWHFAVTFYEAGMGMAIAIVLGLLLGIAAGSSRGATEFLNPIILAFYSIPKIVFLPIFLIIFGTGLAPKIGNAAFHAVFPIILNSLVGMREVGRLHLKVARSMLATRRQLLAKVILPSMVLPVFAGVRLALGLSVLGALLAELFEAKAGVGFVVTQFYSKGLIAEMLAMIGLMFGLILLINAVMQRIENHLSRWRSA
jgi:NitT/TauT family transport system permease protein